MKDCQMSLPEDSLVPQNDIPPVLPENISANSESSNPFSTPKALDQNQFTGIQGKAAALGIGYWILVVAGFLITAVAVTQEPFMGIPLGWVATFSALRVPLRDLRRNALSSPPVVNRALHGAGDYLLSMVLVVGLSFAMCTVFLTVCTVTAIGISSLSPGGSDLFPLTLGISGIFSVVTFLLLFAVSLRL